jgi:signal transduction histidine kinase
MVGARKMERRRALLAELRSTIGFTDADGELLVRFRTLATPSFSAMAEELDALARIQPKTRSILEGNGEAPRFREAFRAWVGELLGGPYDEGYVERHGRLGQLPARLGLELRHVISAMNRVRVSLQRVAGIVLGGEPAALDATRLAVARVCDLDLAIVLESYEDELRQSDRLASTGALAAGLAHEIRNPLNGASLHLSVIERGLARSASVPPAMREAADVLRAEIRRLGELVTDFLEIARPNPLVLEERDLNDLVRDVCLPLAGEASSRKVTLALETSPAPTPMRLDVERTKQVLLNLVRNALEAVDDGGAVTVRVRRLSEHAEIDVVDNGAGIPDPKAPIFDPFYSTKDRGTGLGLAIVQRIVADHGGEISFTSEPGATVFTVRLPAELAHSLL